MSKEKELGALYTQLDDLEDEIRYIKSVWTNKIREVAVIGNHAFFEG